MTPPGVSERDFAAALAAFRGVVGGDWVFTSDQDVGLYRDAYSPVAGQKDERVASAAVAPWTTEQVQAIVRIADRFRIPLYPISTGRNLGYGGSAPNLSGSVILDLKRMNRILRVDDKRHFALVEPGVSYFDLYRHIQEQKLKLWIDCPEPGWGSLIGNAIDRGWGWTSTQARDHFASHCGMEVVLPNGELLRTGMGGRSNADSWQDFPYNFGPSFDGMFSQANLGIVTKMGFWLYPEPEGVLTATISVPGYYDLIPLVETLNYLEHSGIVNGMPQYYSPLLGALGEAPNLAIRKMVGRAGGADKGELDRFAAGRPHWHVKLVFYGPPQITRAHFDYARARIAAAVPGARVANERSYTLPLTQQQQDALSLSPTMDRLVDFGVPNLQGFIVGGRTPQMPEPSRGQIWVSPVLPRTGEAIIKAQNVFVRTSLELDYYFGSNVPIPFTQPSRAFLMVFPILLTDDPAQNAKGRAVMKRVIEVGAENGWLEYRAHPVFQDLIMEQYDFGDHALRRFAERIKDAVDPNGILAAGRYGIWPKAMRKGAA